MLIKSVPHKFRLLLELILLVALLTLVQYFKKLWPNAAPTERGFFCDDESLQYPYHENTISHTWLNILGLYTPLVLIITIELWRYFGAKLQSRNSSGTNNKQPNCCLPTTTCEQELSLQLYRAICTFLLGYACERLFKQVGKFTIGRLRPHFLAVCQPLMPDGSTCADVNNQGRYIMEYTCMGVNSTEKMLRNLHVSFPSGHSSMIFYGMVFLALYLQRSLVGRISRVFRPILQLLCLLLAWFVALSRIMDYKHHWSDVLAGAILGTAIAVFIFYMRYWLLSDCEVQRQPELANTNDNHLECGGCGAKKLNPVANEHEVIGDISEKQTKKLNPVANEHEVIGDISEKQTNHLSE